MDLLYLTNMTETYRRTSKFIDKLTSIRVVPIFCELRLPNQQTLAIYEHIYLAIKENARTVSMQNICSSSHIITNKRKVKMELLTYKIFFYYSFSATKPPTWV